MTTATATKPARAGKRRRTAGPGADPAAQLAAVVGPASIEVAPRHLRVGDGYAATLAITGYPPELGLAWLDVVLSWPGRVDLVEHIDPMPAATAAGRLRTQRARLESSRRLDADKGRLGDPSVDAAAEDAADLADRVARGATRLHRGGHYLCVHAATEEHLVEAVAEVRAAAASVLLDTQQTTWRQLHGWTSPAPLLRDLTSTLEAGDAPAARTLAARLSPWTEGSFRELFDGPTTFHPRGHLVVWSTRQLADELRAPGMLLALDGIWRDVDTGGQSGRSRPEVRRLVVVDEAWTLLRDGEGAKFLYRLAKAARKRRAGVAVVTQDAADLLGSDL